MEKMDILKTKAQIANLKRIASDLPPGTMKQALAKQAAKLGKQIAPFEKQMPA